MFSVIENVGAQTNNVNSSLELGVYVLMVFSAGKPVSVVSDFGPRRSGRLLWLVCTIFAILRLFVVELLNIPKLHSVQ